MNTAGLLVGRSTPQVGSNQSGLAAKERKERKEEIAVFLCDLGVITRLKSRFLVLSVKSRGGGFSPLINAEIRRVKTSFEQGSAKGREVIKASTINKINLCTPRTAFIYVRRDHAS